MSVAFRIRAWPRAAATGAAVAIFLAGGNNGAPHHDGVNHYQAGLVADPRFEAMVSFTDEGWGAKAVPLASAIGWAPSDPTKLDPMAALYWKDAAIEIDRIKNGVTTRRLTGTVAEATVADGKLIITCADLSQKLDKPFTTATFAGTGGIEGGDVATGRAKRRSFGLVWNVEGRLLDKVNNIYEFGDPAFALQGCTALRDMGRAGPLGIIAWQGSIDATLNALKAATPQRGGGLFAPSIACAKWWTQPAGPLTADLQGEASGYSQTPAGVAAQLLAAAGGPAISDTGPARATPVGLHIGDNSETTAGALDRLLQRIAMGWRLSSFGTVELWDYRFTAPVETLRAIFISRDSTVQPVKSRTVGYKKNERIHGEGEISAAVLAGDVVYEDGTTAEDWKPADKEATKGAIAGVNIFIPEIPDIPAPPGLIRNDMLELRRDGGLWYRPYGSEAAAVLLGKIALPDIGAASEASQRMLDDLLNRLSNAVGQALAEASMSRETFRDAGIYVDPATGTVRIAAIDQTAERVSEAYIRLDAMRGEIVQRATVSYVDGKIAQLVLDPSQFPIYEGIELRVYNAEQRISGAEASIAQKASALDLNAQGARLTTAEVIIEALEGQITQKVDNVEFNTLGERVTSAETVLSALGDTAGLTQAVVVARRFPSDIAKAQENALLALLEGDKANRGAIDALASARQELTAGITDARTAFAVARQELIVRIGAAEASALNQARLQIEGDQALATQITNLTASVDDQLAGFDERIFALVMKDDLITAGLAQTISAVRGLGQDAAKAAENALMTLLTGDRTKREQIGAIAAAREEVTALVNGSIEAVVQRISAILARMGVAEASIVAEQFARVTANLAIAAQLVQLGASIGNVDARVELEEIARAALGEALAASIQTLAVEMQDGDAALAAQAVLDRQASIDGDQVSAASIDELRAEKDDGDAAIVAQANLDRQASIDGRDAVAASVDNLRAIRDDDVATLLAMNSEERQARIDADGALSARQDTQEATVNGISGQVQEQAAVLVDLEGKVIAWFRVAATDPDGTTYLEIVRSGGTGQIILGGETKMLGDALVAGTLTADAIEANGITRTFSASNSAAIGLTNDMADTVTFSVTMARPGSIIINSVQQLVFATGGAWETELTVSGNLLMSGSNNVDHQSMLLGSFYAATPGNYTVRLRARRTAGAVSINAGGAQMTVHRTYA